MLLVRAPRALCALFAAVLLTALAATPAAHADSIPCPTRSWGPPTPPALTDPSGYRWDVIGDARKRLRTDAVAARFASAAGTTDFPSMAPVDASPGGPAEYAVINDGGANGPDETPAGPLHTWDSYDGFGGLYVGADLGTADDDPSAHQYAGTDPSACATAAGGRVLKLQTVTLDGLQVQRRYAVSAPGGPAGLRIVSLLYNPTDAPITTRVMTAGPGDLGSDSNTAVHSTATGGDAVTSADRWAITYEDRTCETRCDATLAHIFDGTGGADAVDAVTLDSDALSYRWDDVTVQPGQTAAFLSLEIQKVSPERSTAEEAAALKRDIVTYDGSPAALYADLDAATIRAVRNWAKPKPAVTLQGSDGDQTAGRAATFTATTTPSLEQCPVTTLTWDFGDGSTASGAEASHAFVAGDWMVTVAATDACGQTRIAERRVHVVAAPAVAAGPVTEQPAADGGQQPEGSTPQQGSQATAAAAPLLAVDLLAGAKLDTRTRAVTLGTVRCLKRAGSCAGVRGALYVAFDAFGRRGARSASVRLLRLNVEATSVGAGQHHALVLRLGPKARAALAGLTILRGRTVVRAGDLPLPVSRQVDLSR